VLNKRQKAARKAAKTRAINIASMKRWLEVDKPAHERTVALANERLAKCRVRVRFIPHHGERLMSKSDGMGTLIKVLGTGITWRVQIDGYSGKPRDWHASFWEVI
jgi:hypothetical protein